MPQHAVTAALHRKDENNARIISLKLNPLRGTVLPAPHGKCDFTKKTNHPISNNSHPSAIANKAMNYLK